MSFSILLLLLSLGCVSCENCSETLHETLKKAFGFVDECGDCLTLAQGDSAEGKNWAGFCSGDNFFLFQDWRCREDNDLLNKTDYVLLGSNELCELVDDGHDLNQECLKRFNSEMCRRLSGSEDLGYGGVDEVSFHTPRRTQSTKATTTGNYNTTTMTSSSTTTGNYKTTTTMTPSTTTGNYKTTTTMTSSTTTGNYKTTTMTSSTTTGNYKTTTTTSSSTTTTKSGPLWTKDCEPNEFFFKGHCYFVRPFLESYIEPATNSNTSVLDRWFLNVVRSCQLQHPKALGLAVETMEENDFILHTLFHTGQGRNSLASLHVAEKVYQKAVILTSGIRWGKYSPKPDEWMDWDLKINQTNFNLRDPDEEGGPYHYCIGPVLDRHRHWFLLNPRTGNEKNYSTICERPYNPKNTPIELHKKCLEQYRKSSCYNPERHTNFCCAKDDKGEVWFVCPFFTRTKSFGDVMCEWSCDREGFFKNDRPQCKGRVMCHGSYNGYRYVTSAGRYAIGGCPKGTSGFSTWYCHPNGTYAGTPDYSLCCKGEKKAPHCKDTDAFLNVWMGCPERNVSKKVACPPGSMKKEAVVEWFCDRNRTFSGISPDFSSCNNSQLACVQTDRFGKEWWALLDTTQEQACPHGFVGSCFWKCKKDGKFDGPEPDCSKCKADWMEKIEEKIKNDSNHEEVMHIMEDYTKKEDLRVGYGYVLNLTSDCVALFKKQIPDNEIHTFDKFLKSYSKILKNIAANPILWSSFSVTNRGEYTKQILNTTQNAAFAVLSSKTSPKEKYNVTLATSETDGFDFFVAYGPSVGSRFPLENISQSDWSLDIKKINESNPAMAAMGLVMNYSLTSYMFPSGIETEGLALNAPAVTFTVAGCVDGDVVFDPNVVVSISFKHTNKTKFPSTRVIKRRLHNGEEPSGVFKSTICCYYGNSSWSPEGCSVTYTSKDRTNCTCSHLSTIGLLMSIHKYVPDKTMELLSMLSSGITIVSLILAIVVFFFLDNAKNERVLIGKNLCCCLLLGHIMLLTVLDKKFFNIPERLCTVYAVLLHYVFMSAFAWMFVEGCHLYRMLVLVFDSGIEYRRIYLVIGYGAPVIVVGMTALVGFLSKEEPYGQDEFCWLKPPNYVWAFVGPVIVTTSVNLCILVTATKLAISSRRRIQSSNPYAPKSVFGGEKGLWLKGWISLSTLLGITWFLGLAYIHYNEGLAYAFILLNGLQGFFIFLFRCVLCEQYKNLFLKKMKSWLFRDDSPNHKKRDTEVKSETKLYAVSATKSSAETEAKDSGCDPGNDEGRDFKVLDNPGSSSLTMSTAGISSAGTIGSNINFPSLIIRSSSPRTPDPDNYPELSYHNIYHPN